MNTKKQRHRSERTCTSWRNGNKNPAPLIPCKDTTHTTGSEKPYRIKAARTHLFILSRREKPQAQSKLHRWGLQAAGKKWNRVDCRRSEKRPKTHQRLKRTLFNWIEQDKMWEYFEEVLLFRATYNKNKNKTEKQSIHLAVSFFLPQASRHQTDTS